jgi:ketosteroid isomerase-like protein
LAWPELITVVSREGAAPFFYREGEAVDRALAKMNAATMFAKLINAHDVEGLTGLMTADHVFVDSLGERFPRTSIEKGWRQYFEMVPDYWIRIDRMISEGDTTVLIGYAGGTYVASGARRRSENRWETPAVWVARTVRGKVAEWRIYADNEPIRARMRKAPRKS